MCKQARDLGLKQPLFGGDGWEAPELITIGGKAVEGCYYSTHYSPENTDPAVAAFVDRQIQSPLERREPRRLLRPRLRLRHGPGRRPQARRHHRRPQAARRPRRHQSLPRRHRRDHPRQDQRNATKSATIIALKDGKATFFKTVAP
jgi:branched-chain amino acid transport system substrate-binding protein